MIRKGQSPFIDSQVNMAPMARFVGNALSREKDISDEQTVPGDRFPPSDPSVIGTLLGALLLFATGSAATQVSSGMKSEAKQKLVAAGISESIAEKAVSRSLTTSDKSTLTAEQNQGR